MIKDKCNFNNERFGQEFCFIFIPNLKYSDGDSYRVDIKADKFAVSYDVNFFNLKCTHEKKLIGTIESSCIKNGKKLFFCEKCGILEENIGLSKHEEEIISYTGNCKTKGKKVFKCLDCLQQIEEVVPIQPHNYTILEIIGSDKKEGICKDCNKVSRLLVLICDGCGAKSLCTPKFTDFIP